MCQRGPDFYRYNDLKSLTALLRPHASYAQRHDLVMGLPTQRNQTNIFFAFVEFCGDVMECDGIDARAKNTFHASLFHRLTLNFSGNGVTFGFRASQDNAKCRNKFTTGAWWILAFPFFLKPEPADQYYESVESISSK